MGANPNPSEARAFLPLRPAVFLILLSLAEDELHGWAIAKAVRQTSAGAVRLATGPMYRHLKRLLDAGLIEESERRPRPDEDDERRRYYRLTGLGKEVVSLEAERMATLVEATRNLGLRGAERT